MASSLNGTDGTTGTGGTPTPTPAPTPVPPPPPNILPITCDQYRFPRFSYGAEAGFVDALKQILGFQGIVREDNEYAKYFPALLRLRNNAVVLRNHIIAASACTPSARSSIPGNMGRRPAPSRPTGCSRTAIPPTFPGSRQTGFHARDLDAGGTGKDWKDRDIWRRISGKIPNSRETLP